MASLRWAILNHEQLEELCVLAASGHVNPAELAQVRAHLDECVVCRALFADVGDVHAIYLSEIPGTVAALDCEREIRTKNLILLAARNESAYFSQSLESPAQHEKPGIKLVEHFREIRGWCVAASVCVLGACLATALALRQTRESNRAASPIAPQVATPVRPASDGQQVRTTIRDEELLRKRATGLEAERSRLERLLQESQDENASLQNEISDRKQRLEALSGELEGVRGAEAKTSQELERLKAARDQDQVAIIAQNREIRSLNEKLEDKTASQEQARDVIEAEHGLRELVGARNLHIFDVYDTDSQGRTKKAVGRVFYTEGKSLVFYAYDLSTGHSESGKYAYYVWGNKDGNLENVRNLGTLNTDDLSQNRWKLQVEDAKVLADIDRVFVTVEPVGKIVPHPRGKRILNAYLGSPPNHP